MRLVRPCFEETYQRENAHYRDAAKTLSDLRDATAVLETLDALLHRFGDQVERQATFASIRERLEPEREELAEDAQDLDRRIGELAERMREGRARVDGWDAAPSEYGGARDLQAILGLLDRRRAELQSRAFPLGERLFAEEPAELAARFGTYWRAWKEEAERLPVVGAQPVPVDR